MGQITIDWCMTHEREVKSGDPIKDDCRIIELVGKVSEWDEDERSEWWAKSDRTDDREVFISSTLQLDVTVILAPWADPDQISDLLGTAIGDIVVDSVSSIDLTGHGDEYILDSVDLQTINATEEGS